MAWAVLGLSAEPPGMAQTSPPSTPGHPIGAGAVVGKAPDCSIGSRFDVPAAAAVGRPLTVTLDFAFQCPHLIDRTAALFLVGGLDAPTQPGVRAALEVLVERLSADPGGRLAVMAVADADAPVIWAVTPAERRAAADALLGVGVQPVSDGWRWADRLRSAVTALTNTPPDVRPLLVIVDGHAPSTNPVNGRVAIERAAEALRDSVGFTVVLDASADGWLLGDPKPPSAPGLLGVIDISPGAPALAGGTRRLLGLIDGVVAGWSALVSLDGPQHIVDGSTLPPVPVSGTGAYWQADAAAHTLSIRLRFAVVGDAPMAPAKIGVWVAPHRGNSSGDVELRQNLTPCFYPPDVGPEFCTPPTAVRPATDTPTPFGGGASTPTPTATRPDHPTGPSVTPTSTTLNRAWLPMVVR